MRFLSLLLLLAVPFQATAAPFFIETTSATSEVPTDTGTTGGYQGGGGGARSSQQRVSSTPLEEDPSTAEVPVRHYADPQPTSSYSSQAILESTSSSVAPVQYQQPDYSTPPPLDAKTQEELDTLTLQELEEYADEAKKNFEQQMDELKDGFTVTGTSTLGSPLPANQRSAILRTSVRTVGQLKLFTKALTESDENLRKFTVSDEGVTMTYRSKAYLFGFIPMSYLTAVTASFDGSVTVDTPWWITLARDNASEFEQAITGELTELLTEVETAEESKKFQALSSVIKTMHDTAKSIIQNMRG